ncbi:hypothetical protein ACJJIF_09930 [Microbulbifer sp. SSSA002]|uniref:hypothetical protein n=1 Tax=unclassified Microbulbifer TaxID=2619833 RepID=UPI00403A6D94
MEKNEIGLRDISINCLESSIIKHFKQEVKNISYDSRIVNSFHYYGQSEPDSIAINVQLKVGNAFTAYEDCDFTKLSITEYTKVIEKAVLDVTNVKVFARISEVEFKYEGSINSYVAFHVCLTRQKEKPEALQW